MSSSRNSGPDLSNLPVDVLSEIIKRLEVLDFIRSGAVCRSWRNLSCRKCCDYKRTQIPWLMFSSDKKANDHRYFYSMTEGRKYEIYLPGIGDRHFVGSSQGFLISIDNFADLHATNPLTGTRIPLPPTSASPDVHGVFTDPETGEITHYNLGPDSNPVPVSHRRYHHYRKVILSPSTDVAVAIYGLGCLAYARVGDTKWTALPVVITGRNVVPWFDDVTFHKGRLHAIDDEGTVVIFDDDLSSSGGGKHTVVLPKSSVDNGLASSMSYLVESPDGEDLFFVYREMVDEEDDEELIPITAHMRVFLLDEATYTWKEMTTSLGDVALFIGFNHSMSLCTREYPGRRLKRRNSIYYTDDNKLLAYKNDPELAGDMGVLNFEDGTREPIYVDTDLDRFGWRPPIWFMPMLCSHKHCS